MSARATHVRVADGAIAESFITKEMIATRGHPEGWYVPVVYEAQPTVGRFEYAQPTMKLIGNTQPDENGFFKDCHVLVTYTVAKKNLHGLLHMVWGSNIFRMPGAVEQVEEPMPLVDADLLQQIQYAVEDEIYKQLDAFARQKDYRDFKRLTDYKDSTVDAWREEAQYAISLQDLLWLDYYKLFDEIRANKRPMIKSFADVKAVLPELIWPTKVDTQDQTAAPVAA